MTRKRWADLRDAHLETPEAREAYEKAGQELEVLLSLRERVEALKAAHPEWFRDGHAPR
jgi:hypothetical protein